jgi:hypothetical protein
MRRLCSNSAESSGLPYVTLNGRSFQNLEAFAPETEWEELSCETVSGKQGQENDGDF